MIGEKSSMAKDLNYVCTECGSVASRWQGQCADCQEWNTLTEDAPRYVEDAGTRLIAGIAIPALSLWPESPALPLRAEWALSLHGLSLHGLSLSRAIGDSGAR